MVHTVKNRLQLEGLHDEKSVTFRKLGQTVKKTQPDLEKMGYTEKRVTE